MNIEIMTEPAQTPEEKKKQLFLSQKELLDTFLAHHAITRQQYDKSLHDLAEKMGIDNRQNNLS